MRTQKHLERHVKIIEEHNNSAAHTSRVLGMASAGTDWLDRTNLVLILSYNCNRQHTHGEIKRKPTIMPVGYTQKWLSFHLRGKSRKADIGLRKWSGDIQIRCFSTSFIYMYEYPLPFPHGDVGNHNHQDNSVTHSCQPF